MTASIAEAFCEAVIPKKFSICYDRKKEIRIGIFFDTFVPCAIAAHRAN